MTPIFLALNQRSVKLCTYSFLFQWISVERRILSRAGGDEKGTPLEKISCSERSFLTTTLSVAPPLKVSLSGLFSPMFCRNAPHSGGPPRLPLEVRGRKMKVPRMVLTVGLGTVFAHIFNTCIDTTKNYWKPNTSYSASY